MKTPKEEYLKQAKKLSKKEAEYLIIRMGKKLGRRIDDEKLVAVEALAIQLEIEDEKRNEWRKNFAEVKARFEKL